MKSKISLAALAVAAVMLAMPANAQAGFHSHGWAKMEKCLFGWMHRHHGKADKVVYKKKGMKKGKKKAMK
jgi:hypothetical protein